MRSISSHPASKMRVLVLSAILACAAAAPSYIAPVPLLPLQVASVSADDLQAAAINAQVKAEDHARALADQARELAEQAIENQQEGIVEGTDLAKERSEEAFWAAEDKKWQAINAAQTAEAAIGGALASNEALRSSLAYVPGVVPVLSKLGAVAVTPVAGLSAAVSSDVNVQTAAGEVANVKSAEAAEANNAEKPVEAAAEEKKDAGVQSADVKSADAESVEVQAQSADQVAQEAPKTENVEGKAFHSVVHPVPVGLAPYSYQSIVPNVAYAQVGLRSLPVAAFPQFQAPFYTPTVIKAIY
ncbi:pupal cuticle protein PCP52-like [Zerene cesonia]|uniref:pupal cuticle protein PCP52-like n=1 Tax=Zerene cesonia TaxID=33412 RepID=UPI0018E562AF|nr:pupal cuticle protein PCP52-like [Zerene cesonia]